VNLKWVFDLCLLSLYFLYTKIRALPVVVILAVDLGFSEETAGVGLEAGGTETTAKTVRVILKTIHLVSTERGQIKKFTHKVQQSFFNFECTLTRRYKQSKSRIRKTNYVCMWVNRYFYLYVGPMKLTKINYS